MPQPPIPQPGTPNPETPKPADPQPSAPEPKPVEPAPDQINWIDTADSGFNKDQISETGFWEHFTDMVDKAATKPVMIYFYYPDEETSDENIANMIRRCALMEENIFNSEDVKRASLKFHCMKCNFKDDMGEDLKKKYKITVVPKVLFFDVRGKKAWQLTSSNSKPEGVAKKMNDLARISEKLLEKMKK